MLSVHMLLVFRVNDSLVPHSLRVLPQESALGNLQLAILCEFLGCRSAGNYIDVPFIRKDYPLMIKDNGGSSVTTHGAGYHTTIIL
jgi:hypothetical protein